MINNQMDSNQLSEHIESRLHEKKEILKSEFQNNKKQIGIRYCSIDDLLPDKIALQIYSSFPDTSEMRFMHSVRERKYTSKDFDRHDSLLKEITFAIQAQPVIRKVEEITGIKNQCADPTLYAGGLSSMKKGNFLNPHIDNSHNMDRSQYRTLNLLYYVTPEWQLEYGGNLELWNKQLNRNVTIHSKFNRLVLMETNPWSWHSVSPVVTDSASRNCVSNYYFSPDPPVGDKHYYHVTRFHGRPGQFVKRLVLPLDGSIRDFVRRFKPDGLGKKDFYRRGENV